LIHSGRVWRTIYWVFPYDFTRDIWPNVRSALIWDPSAILTYLTGTVLFVYVGLLPDLAIARDRADGMRRAIYGALALGFRGTTRQWRMQATAGLLLSALILPVFVSVHSIVAWDLSMAVLPSWHTTLLAPYFVMGAVHSGVAGVVIVMVALRRALHLEAYIRADHFDKIGRLQIVVAFGYLYFFLSDFFFGLFGRDPLDERIWELRLFESPTNLLMLTQILATLLVPLPLWCFARVRTSPALMLGTAIVVNIGMWLERYLLVVTPQSLKQPFVFTWVSTYEPRPMEYLFTVVSIAVVASGVLLFAKLLPIVPIADVKEPLVHAAGHLRRD
jgi:Ni/Fe-hydrogenase subunit HybB-like protein